MKSEIKIIIITIFALLTIIFGYITIKLHQNKKGKLNNFSYWFTLSFSISLIFGMLFIFSWFW